MILAESQKTDLSHVATSHLIRLIIIVTIFPFFVNSYYDADLGNFVQETLKDQNLSQLLTLIIFSIILILIFDRFKLPAALLSGTLVASGFLQITEIASYQISPMIVNYCLLILGASVGCRFADKTFNEVAKNAFHSIIATFLLVLLGVIAAYVASLIINKNFFCLLYTSPSPRDNR